mmetsp:Transcript_35975/g.70711  ORF Transcript_35975/g.70711 Transcript_35975/m.70711 type:complete len:264 (-) Transcript_35975:307-1098(-)
MALSGFYVMVTGQIEGCQFPGGDNLYCKYSFKCGLDWIAVNGLQHGISQIARRSSGVHSQVFVWNYPIDLTFRSTNVHGWPQIVLSVYGINMSGKDVIKGYGWVHVPLIPGRYTQYCRLYAPKSSSWCAQLIAWLTGNPPEFFDAKFVAQGKGREVTRVESAGTVKIVLNVVTKNMNNWNFQINNERTGDSDSEEDEEEEGEGNLRNLSKRSSQDRGEMRRRKGKADSSDSDQAKKGESSDDSDSDNSKKKKKKKKRKEDKDD